MCPSPDEEDSLLVVVMCPSTDEENFPIVVATCPSPNRQNFSLLTDVSKVDTPLGLVGYK